MNAALFKQWKISETLLNRAHAALPRSGNESAFFELEKRFTEYLKHNEYELALNVLEELGDLKAPRGGFWKDLMRAAENMTLFDRIPQLRKKFHDAPLPTGDSPMA
jgi:hypothetical protein